MVTPTEPYCSFCGKERTEVRRLIEGKDGIYICDDCVLLGAEILAEALEQAEARDYFNELRTMYHAKRDLLLNALDDVGLTPMTPDGSYFIIVDTSKLPVKVAEGARRDVSVCRCSRVRSAWQRSRPAPSTASRTRN